MAHTPKDDSAHTRADIKSASATTPKSESLEQFFRSADSSTLDNCDTEPVHKIGSVQQQTGFLAVAKSSHELVGFSENLTALVRPISCDGAKPYDFSCLLPELARECRALLPVVRGYHALMESNLRVGDDNFQCIFYQHGPNYYIELMPEAAFSLAEFRRKANDLRRACGGIMAADNFAEALDIAAEQAKAQTGFARVNIYQFQHDWSGKVVAEVREDRMQSFMGLYFPASDIPQQARYLQTLVPYRSIGDSGEAPGLNIVATAAKPDQDPFDMTWSLARAVSPIHLLYLRNMGVAASVTASLLKKGKLWGLIACHHDAPGILPFDQWESLNTLATVLMSKLDQIQAREHSEMMSRLRDIEQRIADTMRLNGNIEESLSAFMPQLRVFFRADGFAFSYGDHVHTEGEVPPDDFIRRLISWAGRHADPFGSFATHSLPMDWPEAQAYADIASGVLIDTLQLHRSCHLVWFRKPLAGGVTWAGKPEPKPVYREPDGSEKLMPRRSFELWSEENGNRSEPWAPAEVSSARELLTSTLDIVTRQIQLSRANRDMETFSFSAAHDLKTPLRHMSFALEILQSEGVGGDREKIKQLVANAVKSYDRLKNTIDGLMKLLELENTQPLMGVVSLASVIGQAQDLLADDIAQSKAAVVVSSGSLPRVHGNLELLRNVLVNLMTNAIKYCPSERPLVITIETRVHGTKVDVLLADNGQGIPTDKADDVFKPFKRLHRYDNVAGSGLGLSICQRSVAAMGGDIYLDNRYRGPGARFVITLALVADE